MLEDFVRWYSPRDWIETEEEVITPAKDDEPESRNVVKKYGLSNRMKIPGNMWIEVKKKENR